MDRLIRGISCIIQAELHVDEEDIEIYQFGIECILLKLIHIATYLLIGIFMKELISLLVSASILIPLRRKAGGYHAKTRTGCYIFSCCTVILLCLINKVTMAPLAGTIGMLAADILILLFAPIENVNRVLEHDEKILFRRQAIGVLITANVIVFVILIINKPLFLAYWLENGITFTGALLFLGLKDWKI